MSTAAPVLTEAYLDEYIGDQSVEACIVMTVLATFVLGFRFYSKLLVMRTPWGTEDALLLGAYVLHEGLCVLGILLVRRAGAGYHVQRVEQMLPVLDDDDDDDDGPLALWARYVLAFELAHLGAACLPKMAVVCVCARALGWRGGDGGGGRAAAAARAVQGLLAAAGVASCVAAGLQCVPLARWWRSAAAAAEGGEGGEGGRCIDVEAFFRAQAVVGPVLDVLVVALPVPTVWGLRGLAPRKRAELVLVFSVGSFGIIASIIRATVFFHTSPFADRTWATVELTKWGVIEVGTYIITACLPDLRPLLHRRSRKRVVPGGGGDGGGGPIIKRDDRQSNDEALDEERPLPPPTAPRKTHHAHGCRRPRDAEWERNHHPPPTFVPSSSPARLARRWYEPHNSLRSWGASAEGTAGGRARTEP